jgi:hypothetical protein
MSDTLPPGFLTIGPAKLPSEEFEEPNRNHDRRKIDNETAFPEHLETGTPEELANRLYACSGSPDSMPRSDPISRHAKHGLDRGENRA